MATEVQAPLSPMALEHSPDGEPRGLLARVGDIFPLDPSEQRLLASHEPPSPVRPWGLRFARPPQPRAGAHEGGTKDTTGDPDGNSPGEETASD
jgi:hypothetical protein